MKYWLIKSEPGAYSWDDFVKLGRDHWDGVRNYQARNNMMEMKVGDQALFYHSVHEKNVVGIAEVVAEHQQDPLTDDERWRCVEFAPVRALARPVNLAEVKEEKSLKDMVLVNNTRLSVQPVLKKEFEKVLKMGEK